MDKTYNYLYERLYKHFYKFCIAGDMTVRELIESMEGEIKGAKDTYLEQLYQIIFYAVTVEDKQSKTKFTNLANQCEQSFDDKSYDEKWRLYSVLYLIYRYIYPDSNLAKKCKDRADIAAQKLAEVGENGYQIEFEDADYAIQRHIEKESTINSAYTEEFTNRDFRLKNRSFMTILKGFSSSTPFFYPALRERFHNIPIKGGGIFIKWLNHGIVIDPGINFVENMHMMGLNLNDINTIIVTHNHIDHNGDLPTIDDLASQFDRKDISIYMDVKTQEEFRGRLGNFAESNRHCIDLNNTKEFCINSNICVNVIQTKHVTEPRTAESEAVRYIENASYALKISMLESGIVRARIGFTSDTRYLSELSELFADCDYIIANISETNLNDYLGKQEKDKHLGYYGCRQLIKECNAKRGTELSAGTICDKEPRYIISEFWAGKGDVRKELVQRLRKETGYDFIYPGDIGMLFFLDQATFLCGYCGSEKDLDKLHSIKPGMEYARFSNVCSECILL